MVDRCLECDYCKGGLEPYCAKHATWTLPNAAPRQRHWRKHPRWFISEFHRSSAKSSSQASTSRERACCVRLCFVPNHDVGCCVSPLRHGRLAHGKQSRYCRHGGWVIWGVKLARALGAHVVAFTTSEGKNVRTPLMKLGASGGCCIAKTQERDECSNGQKLDFI